MFIYSKAMKILLREYEDFEFGIIGHKLNSKGTAIYKLKIFCPDNDKDIIKSVYIAYDHEDKELYGRVVEMD